VTGSGLSVFVPGVPIDPLKSGMRVIRALDANSTTSDYLRFGQNTLADAGHEFSGLFTPVTLIEALAAEIYSSPSMNRIPRFCLLTGCCIAAVASMPVLYRRRRWKALAQIAHKRRSRA